MPFNPKTLEALKYLGRTGIGAGAGGAIGYSVTPRVAGYEDVEPARRVSALIDAAVGASIGGLAHRAGGVGKLLTNIPTKATFAIPTAVGAGEVVPLAIATLTRTRKAMDNMSEAGKDISEASKGISEAGKSLADSSKVTSIPYNIQRLAQSSTARGAGIGAAGAGLAAILSGLSRRRSENEILKNRERGGMVGADFLKYLIPAMVAGGVVGSLHKNT
jgi:hypothetical protein